MGWFGSKELAGFRAGSDPIERLRMARAASRHATLNMPIMQRLRAATKTGTLTLMEGCHISAVDRTHSRWRIRLQKAGSLSPSRDDLARPQVKAVEAGAATERSASSQQVPSAQSAADSISCSQAGRRNEVFADVMWLATGTSVDVLADPVLGQLQGSCPTRVVGGYPVLDDSTLAWPGLPLFLLGRSALLTSRPCRRCTCVQMHQLNQIFMLAYAGKML